MEHKVYYSNVSRETFENLNKLFERKSNKLLEYADILIWWNKRINLISRKTSFDEIINHIQHSLLLSFDNSFLNYNSFLIFH